MTVCELMGISNRKSYIPMIVISALKLWGCVTYVLVCILRWDIGVKKYEKISYNVQWIWNKNPNSITQTSNQNDADCEKTLS